MGQADLDSLLSTLPAPADPRLVVGNSGAEDAAVFRLGDGRLLLQTVDFITPVTDDPELFGRIAAANALSDIWAMGGEPWLALAICAFPKDELPLEVLGGILRGGAGAAREAGIEVAGGHTIVLDVPVYGLAVTGVTTEDRLWRNSGASPGDELVMSKPIGNGVLTAAYRAERLGGAGAALRKALGSGSRISDEEESALLAAMSRLSGSAAAAARNHPVKGATDITGFGLLGHLHELASNSGLALELDAAAVPMLPGAARIAAAGIAPAGSRRNLAAASAWLDPGDTVETSRLLLADAQTNGGLVFVVPPGAGAGLVADLRAAGWPDAAVVARFVAEKAGRVKLTARTKPVER